MPRIIKPAVGSFTASNITVDSSGRIVAASSGAGAANMIRTFTRKTMEQLHLPLNLQQLKFTCI